jgi:hypothetical protein
MIPVREGKDDLVIVKILVGIFRIMNDQWTAKTVGILAALMAVVPVSSWLVDLLFISVRTTSLSDWKYREVVRERTTWRDCTLRHAYRAIHVCRLVHIQPVEVQ